MSSRVSYILIASLAVAVPLTAQEKTSRRFRVVNASPQVIHQIYVCPTGDSKWGANLLTQDTAKAGSLKPGQKTELALQGACGLYDLRFVAEGGVEYLLDEEEFCEDDDVVTIGGGAGRAGAGTVSKNSAKGQKAKEKPKPNR